MADHLALRCTLCDSDFYNVRDIPADHTFDSLEALDDHLAMHALESSGKLFHPSSYDNIFFCHECRNNDTSSQFVSCSSALVHFKIHDELRKASSMVANIRYIYKIIGSQVRCISCNNLNKEIMETTEGKCHGTKKVLFDNASEYIQHFFHEHMKTKPHVVNVVECAWTNECDTKEFKMKHCSFCGSIKSSFYYDTYWWKYCHFTSCLTKHKEIQKEAISTFLLCYNKSSEDDSQCCLRSLDKHIIHEIIRHIL